MADLRVCSVLGCGKPHKAFGLCNTHRLRLARRGTTDRDPSWIRGLNCSRGQKIGQCPAAKAIVGHLEYLRNKDQYLARAKSWDAANKDRKRELMATESALEKARIRMRAWSKANPEKVIANNKKFYAQNQALIRSYKARRRARVRQAVPPWITDEQVVAVQAIYAESEHLSVATGIDHEVDHILPLAGKVIFGLHVPWNLRVLTRDDNNRRPRIPSRADLDALGEDQMAWLRTQGLALPRPPNQ